MNKKLKKILGIIAFVLLFVFVVYMKTEQKLKRTRVIKPDNIEQLNRVIEASKQNKAKVFEEAQQKETQKRDSIRQIQRDELEAQKKKSEEILKSLNKENE
jgi:hypothetical protein